MFTSGPSSTLVSRPPQTSQTSKNGFGIHIPRSLHLNFYKSAPPQPAPSAQTGYAARTPTTKYEPSNRPPPPSPPREGTSWYTPRPPTAKTYGNSTETTSRNQHHPMTSSTSRAYESNYTRSSPSYAIYQGASKDVYVYEPSLSSKSDNYSPTDTDGASLATYSPSGLSTMTLKSPALSDLVLEEDGGGASRAFPINFPSFTQASSTIKGPSRPESSSAPLYSFPSHVSSTRYTDEVLTTQNQGWSVPSGSQPDATTMPGAVLGAHGYPIAVPVNAHSVTSDSETGDIDHIAKANTMINSFLSGHLYQKFDPPLSTTPSISRPDDKRATLDVAQGDPGSRRNNNDIPIQRESYLIRNSDPRVSGQAVSTTFGRRSSDASSSYDPSSSTKQYDPRLPRGDAAMLSGVPPSGSSYAPPTLRGQSNNMPFTPSSDTSPTSRPPDRRQERPLPMLPVAQFQRSKTTDSPPTRATHSPPGGLSEYFRGANRNSPPRPQPSADPAQRQLTTLTTSRYQELPPPDSPCSYEPQVITAEAIEKRGALDYVRSRKDSLGLAVNRLKKKLTSEPTEMYESERPIVTANGTSMPMQGWDSKNDAAERDRERPGAGGVRTRTYSQSTKSSSRSSPPRTPSKDTPSNYETYGSGVSRVDPVRRESPTGYSNPRAPVTHSEPKYDQWNIPLDPVPPVQYQAQQVNSNAVSSLSGPRPGTYPTVSSTEQSFTSQPYSRSVTVNNPGPSPRSSARNAEEYRVHNTLTTSSAQKQQQQQQQQQPPHRRYSDSDHPSSRAQPHVYAQSQSAVASSSGSSSGSISPALGYVSATPTPQHQSGERHGHPEPHRRYSDGDQTAPPLLARNRSVRWDDNLICPSPILAGQRRKGWWNRRGDQLWTNDGQFKRAAPGEEYPPDLDCYPECNQGWQNEEGVRIDMGHRLIPKTPLRSALKIKPASGTEMNGSVVNITHP